MVAGPVPLPDLKINASSGIGAGAGDYLSSAFESRTGGVKFFNFDVSGFALLALVILIVWLVVR